jgi:hypothetical protein
MVALCEVNENSDLATEWWVPWYNDYADIARQSSPQPKPAEPCGCEKLRETLRRWQRGKQTDADINDARATEDKEVRQILNSSGIIPPQPKPAEPCHRCHGSKRVESRNTQRWVDCPECHGEGTTPSMIDTEQPIVDVPCQSCTSKATAPEDEGDK